MNVDPLDVLLELDWTVDLDLLVGAYDTCRLYLLSPGALECSLNLLVGQLAQQMVAESERANC
jgi:hypothetical protein